MNSNVNRLKVIITKRVASMLSTATFDEWFRGEGANDRDIVVINNSFIYRKPLIRTSKNKQYLCMRVKGGKPNPAEVLVTTPGDFNSDFKLLNAKSSSLPSLEPLDKALERELKQLGQLVLVLIGTLEDVPATVPVGHSYMTELKFNPLAKSEAVIEPVEGSKKAIVVNQLTDPETAWNAVKPELKLEVGEDLPSLETKFATAFEKLQDQARLRLRLPEPAASQTTTSFIARLRKSVAEQRKLYEAALKGYSDRSGDGDVHLREVMRIAYNFADDAIKVLQLLVSIADLKGVLLWCALKQHFDIAEAFRNLPWTKSDKKPSLERYREIINGARNRAFHNLLAFDRTIEADLAGVRVNARRLTLLPAHGRRKRTAAFDYQDREMVEILTELTRAPEVAVRLDFWKKNAAVMSAFEGLLMSTEEALHELNRARD